MTLGATDLESVAREDFWGFGVISSNDNEGDERGEQGNGQKKKKYRKRGRAKKQPHSSIIRALMAIVVTRRGGEVRSAKGDIAGT